MYRQLVTKVGSPVRGCYLFIPCAHHLKVMKKSFTLNSIEVGKMLSTSLSQKHQTKHESKRMMDQQSRYCHQHLRREPDERIRKKFKTSVVMYLASIGIFFIGLTYAAVPAYRAFCQQMGWGGKAEQAKGHKTEKVATMTAMRNRKLRIHFSADTGSSMRWNFKPIQETIRVCPGETALAFYTAKNPAQKAVTGIATYNVVPLEAGLYFNKIQCFCFEEQRLDPGEEVDMPVFFYIDPDICDDHKLENIDDIWLSYHFFEAKPGIKLPLPEDYVPLQMRSGGKLVS